MCIHISISLNKLILEIVSATLSKCSCDQSDNTNMEVGIAGGEDETDPKWTVKISSLTLYLMREEG